MRNRGAALLACVIGTFLVLVSASPVAAAPDVSITTVVGDRYTPGKPVAFLVDITASKATRGSVVVRVDGAETARTEFEVAGGATKQVIIVSETLIWGAGIVVAIDSDDGNEVYRPRLNEDRESEQVGLLPSLADVGIPATATSATGGRTVRFHPLSELVLQADSRALDMFDTIAGSPDDLNTLPAEVRTKLLAWTARGGSLMVDGPAGSNLEGLDLASTDRTEPYGFGTVQFSDGSIRRGDADGLIPATVRNNIDEFGPPIDPSQSGRLLVADAGISVPGIGPLIALLGVYILVVGPVLYLVLRRLERLPLAWLAIPAAAIFTIATVWGVGRAQRSNVESAHATIIASVNGVLIEHSEVLVASANGGFVGVSASDGFAPVGSNWDRFGNTSNKSVVQRDGAFGVNMNAGEASRMRVERISPDPGSAPLQLSTDVQDRTLVGTVTNSGDLPLEDVRVAAGNAVQLVGTLDPGESAEIGLDDHFATAPLADDVLFRRMEQDFFDPFNGEVPAEGSVNAGALAGFVARYPQARATGSVLAIGWTREPNAPVRSDDGDAITRGRTAMMTIQPVGSDNSPTVEYGEASAILHRIWDFEMNDRAQDGAELQSEFLISLPGDADSNALYVLVAGPDLRAIDIWNGTQWDASSDRIVDDSGLIFLDRSEVRNGQVHIRTAYNLFEGVRIPVLRSQTASDARL